MQTLSGFPGGIHPPENKTQSSETPIHVLALPPLLILPLKQHVGEAAIAVVTEGDNVRRGQLIARAADGRSAPIHAPADGVISFIGLHPVAHDSGLADHCIAIAANEQSGELLEVDDVDVSQLNDADIRERIADAGIVGLGGAGFPTAAKLSNKPVQWLIINGAECEPYITCDDRLMRERAGEIIEGVRILARLLKPENILFAIEDNKPEAIKAVANAAYESNIELAVIPTKYPSGAQKQLIQNLLGLEIPVGEHSIDFGVVMYNVGTCYAVARALAHSEPLISRIVTVTGNAVARPGNYEVAIGTPIEYLLEHAGIDSGKLARVIMGGPIMGVAVTNLSAPITKISNCLIAAEHGELDEDLRARECIRCGFCVDACPASLLPQQLYWFIKSEQVEKAENLHLRSCIECGACAYVCPSHIPLVQYYRHGKAVAKQTRAEKQQAELAKQRYDFRLLRIEREKEARANRHKQSAKIHISEAGVEGDKSVEVNAAVARAKAKKEALAAAQLAARENSSTIDDINKNNENPS